MPGLSAKSVKKAAMLAGADLAGIASTDRFDKYPEENRQLVFVNIIKELMDLRKALRKDCRAWDYSSGFIEENVHAYDRYWLKDP